MFGKAHGHRADVDYGLRRAARHAVDDAQIAFAQFMSHLRQVGVNDDDVNIGVVDHDFDRFHVN
nr:hypothetical protein [Bradyrhizobium sp. CCBAU 25360]